jgi:tRNA-dihydrouridine synthase
MEGVTSAPYRQAHHRHFSGVDRYYAPFISPTIHHVLTPKEQRDILPEFNDGVPVIPQLLTKNIDDFLWAAGDLAAMGYTEVNLNLGCPSGTVVSKGKGSGFLAHLAELERFLDEVYEKSPLSVSVKTRLGVVDPDEFGPILELYNRYPIPELTIHPRVQKQMYRGEVALGHFAKAVAESKNPLCYNGDLNTSADIQAHLERFPTVQNVMLGRGFVADPALAQKAKGGAPADRATLEAFHNDLFEGFASAMKNQRNAMLRMKEIWFYHINLFDDNEKHVKRLRKATDINEFLAAAAAIFRELPLREDVSPSWKK